MNIMKDLIQIKEDENIKQNQKNQEICSLNF